MALSVKGNATVAYPVILVLLKFLKRFCRFFFHHVHTLVAFLPVAICETSTVAEDTGDALKQSDITLSAVMALSNELPLTSSRDARDMKLKVFNESMQGVPRSLNDIVEEGSQVSIGGKPKISLPKKTFLLL